MMTYVLLHVLIFRLPAERYNQLAISFTSVPYVPQSSYYNKIPNLRGESLFKQI